MDIDDFGFKSPTAKARRALESIGKLSHEGIKTMDQHMYEAVLKSDIITLDGAREYVCDIFNTAYYITTLILMDENPMLNFRAYLNKADEVGADGGCKNTYHEWFQGMTMAMVCNYLRALNPRYLDVDEFVKFLNNFFTNRYSSQESVNFSLGGNVEPSAVNAIMAQQLFYRNILSEKDAQSLAVFPNRFLPRPIDAVLEESNYEDINNNIVYIKECIDELPKGRQKKAVNTLVEITQITGEEALQGAMPDAAEYVQEIMQFIFSVFGFNHVPVEVMADTDEKEREEEAADNAPQQNSADDQDLLAKVQAELAETKAALEEMKAGIAAEVEHIDFPDKVRLELLLRLMKNDGADLDKYGSKTQAAAVLADITGLPLQTCKNYCSDQNLNRTYHKDNIHEMNTRLEALGMSIRL